MSWKKNQACCRAASLTVLVLTTHCRASSSWSSWSTDQARPGQDRSPRQRTTQVREGGKTNESAKRTEYVANAHKGVSGGPS